MTTRMPRWLAFLLPLVLAIANHQTAWGQYRTSPVPIHPAPYGFVPPHTDPYSNQYGNQQIHQNSHQQMHQHGYPQVHQHGPSYRPQYEYPPVRSSSAQLQHQVGTGYMHHQGGSAGLFPLHQNGGNQVSWGIHGSGHYPEYQYHSETDKHDSVVPWLKSGCSKGGCRVCGPNPCACWTITGGALALHRSTPRNDVLVTDGFDMITGGQFQMGWAPGFELGVTRHNLVSCWDLVVRGMYVDGWSASSSARAIIEPTQIETNPPTQIAGLRDVTAYYASEFGSLEFMARRRLPMHESFSLLAGFRMLYMADDLSMEFEELYGDFGTVFYDTSTRNHLFGPQIGAQWDVYCGPKWAVQTWGSLGIYGNNARTKSLVYDEPLGGFPQSVFTPSGREARFAFSGEIGVSTRYHFTQSLALRADYRLLWIDGLAVASEQVNATNLDLGGIRAGGTVFYHGAFLGVDYTF